MKYTSEKIYEKQSNIISIMVNKLLDKMEEIVLLKDVSQDKYNEDLVELSAYLNIVNNIPFEKFSKEDEQKITSRLSKITFLFRKKNKNYGIFYPLSETIGYRHIWRKNNVHVNYKKAEKIAKRNITSIAVAGRIDDLSLLISEISTEIRQEYKNDMEYISEFFKYIKQLQKDFKFLKKNKNYLTDIQKKDIKNYENQFKIFKNFQEIEK